MVDLYIYKTTWGERNFTEGIKAPILLQAVLAIEIIKEPQSNLEEKVNPSILKDDFSSRIDPCIFTSIAPVLLVTGQIKTVGFFQHWNQQATSCPTTQCLVDQIQAQKQILVVVTDQMPDHT